MKATPQNRTANFLIFILLGCLAAGSAWARDGSVFYSSGEVQLERNGKTMALAKKELVQSGDTIITGDTGRAQIRMADDTLIALAPNSRFKIEEYRAPASAADTQGRSIYSHTLGAFRMITGLIGKKDPSAFAVKTPVATMGIRGTEPLMTLCQGCRGPDGNLIPDGLYGKVVNGSITISNPAGKLAVSVGQLFYVASNTVAPVLVTVGPALAFLQDLELALTFELGSDGIDLEIEIEPEPVNSPS